MFFMVIPKLQDEEDRWGLLQVRDSPHSQGSCIDFATAASTEPERLKEGVVRLLPVFGPLAAGLMTGDPESTELLSRNGKNCGCQRREAMKQRCDMTTSVTVQLGSVGAAQLTS